MFSVIHAWLFRGLLRYAYTNHNARNIFNVLLINMSQLDIFIDNISLRRLTFMIPDVRTKLITEANFGITINLNLDKKGQRTINN